MEEIPIEKRWSARFLNPKMLPDLDIDQANFITDNFHNIDKEEYHAYMMTTHNRLKSRLRIYFYKSLWCCNLLRHVDTTKKFKRLRKELQFKIKRT